MQLLESGEMYLETIFVLSQKQDVVRSIDIANYTGYSKPSVSRAVNLLKDNGYISINDDGYITLENSGLEVAKTIYERHTLLTKMLCGIGVSKETASADACKMEHVISDETFERIKEHLNKFIK
ncbi:MAG: metal-dependent transcriptional regulator [Clostridia bacterium]|nr:metal-dependent transcriptional regulator [Clostridia bacterium]